MQQAITTGQYWQTMCWVAISADVLTSTCGKTKGWTYGPYCFQRQQLQREIHFQRRYKAAATDSAVTEVMKELKNYADNGITADEISFMKNHSGSVMHSCMKPAQKPGFVEAHTWIQPAGKFCWWTEPNPGPDIQNGNRRSGKNGSSLKK